MLSDKLDKIEQELNTVNSDTTHANVKNRLAQLNGDVDKIQTQGIDAVILGPNPPPNADEIKSYRSSLVRRSDKLALRISNMVAASALPQQSSFAFLQNGSLPTDMGNPINQGSPSSFTIQPEVLNPPVETAFNFMQQDVQAVSTTSTQIPAETVSMFSFIT